jgi:membrane associated rhomboid family serine protease
VAGRLQKSYKNKSENKIVKLIILVGIMVGGLSYWFNPYDELSLLGISIYKLMGAGAFLGSLSLTLILNKRPWEIALLITTGK